MLSKFTPIAILIIPRSNSYLSVPLIKLLPLNNITKRTMINSRCLYAARTAYNCLQALTNNAMLDQLLSDNHHVFNKEIGLLSLDTSTGIPQHKKAIVGHMLNHPFKVKEMYDLSIYKDKISTHETIGPSSHVITALPVCEKLLDHYSTSIQHVKITSDTLPLIMEGQKQSNFDYIVTVTAKILDKAFHLTKNQNIITRMQDCKDGSSILKHSTRGSLGIITFDKQGKNIQTTPYPITEADLKAFN